MGIAVPIVTTIGTVAGVASQQRAAAQQADALRQQAQASALNYETQLLQLQLSKEAASVRGGLEMQVAQQEAQIARNVLEQQRLSQALEIESARAGIAQQSYQNLLNKYSGLTQALELRTAASGLTQQAASAYETSAGGMLSASSSRSQGRSAQAQAYMAETQPIVQATEAERSLGASVLESRRADAQQALQAEGAAQNRGALGRVAQTSEIRGAATEGIIMGRASAQAQMAGAGRQFLQADIQERQAKGAEQAAQYYIDDAGRVVSTADLQARAAMLQYGMGETMLNYNRSLVDAQSAIDSIRMQQANLDLSTGLDRNLLSTQQRNLANVANLQAAGGAVGAQYASQLSGIAANTASITRPNILATAANIGTAWLPTIINSRTAPQLQLQQGSPTAAWSPLMDVRPSYNNPTYA